MNADNIARQTIIRLNYGDVIDRLQLFLSDPASASNPGYHRIHQLLDIARQRREAARHASR